MLQRKKKRCQVLRIEGNSERLSCCEYFHSVQLDFTQADLRFGQETQESQSAAKKVIDVNKVVGPFSDFTEKKTASLMQKFIVPWNIAIHGLSYAKKLTKKGHQGPGECNHRFRKPNALISRLRGAGK